MIGKKLQLRVLRKLFQYYDNDENGMIDLNEFLNEVAKKRKKDWYNDRTNRGGSGR